MESFSNPINNTSFYTRKELESFGFKYLGDNVLISRLARIYTPERMSIGNCVRIDDFAILSGAISLGQFIHISAHTNITGGNGKDSSVSMGDFCGMSSYSKIFATTDDFAGGYLVCPCVPFTLRNVRASHIQLERHCHIGSHSLILPQSHFCIGASLGPMSLNMGRKFKAWHYYYGNPAKPIYKIDSHNVLDKETILLNSTLKEQLC